MAFHQGSAVKYKEGVQDGIISSSHALRKLGRRGGGKGHGTPRKNHICWRGVHPPGRWPTQEPGPDSRLVQTALSHMRYFREISFVRGGEVCLRVSAARPPPQSWGGGMERAGAASPPAAVLERTVFQRDFFGF